MTKRQAKRKAAHHAAYYRKNRKRLLRVSAAWYRKNRKKILTSAAAYHRKNRKKILKQRKEHHKTMVARHARLLRRDKKQLAPRGIKGQRLSLKADLRKFYFADGNHGQMLPS